MEPRVLYKETQRFKQWWLWLLLGAINVGLGVNAYSHFVLNKPMGDPPISDWGVVLLLGFTLTLSVLFLSFTLHTQITSEGIQIRFFPIHRRYRTYEWKEISKVYCRTYSPIREYGGWGIRYGFFGKGIAYNISGNQGLQLELNNQKKVLIGTQNPQTITQVLQPIIEAQGLNKELST